MEITITIPEQLARMASASGMATAAYVEQLLGKIVPKPNTGSGSEEEQQDRVRKELLADWDHYQATGLHLTSEEVDDWLAKLEKGEAVEPPALHI